jgi:hypothetical protein
MSHKEKTMIIHRVEVSGARVCQLGESGEVIFDFPRLSIYEAKEMANGMQRTWVENHRHPALREGIDAT